MRARALIAALAMLAAIVASVIMRAPFVCGAVGAVVLVARIVAARGRWTPSGAFGVANAITAGRLAVVVALPMVVEPLGELAFAALLVMLFLLDGIDGAVARARRESSEVGAAFDMETDALSVAVLSLVAWERALAPVWVLVAGLWRYVYAALVAAVPSLGEAPRSRLGRAAFFVLMVCFIGAFACRPAARVLAAIGVAVLSLSFVYSLVRSKAVTNSAAASSQPRDGGRIA
jgi:phosphatidylglycerophosphate synthase